MFFSRQRRVSWLPHTNPDGSIGGSVASTAEVGLNVTIGKTAIILPGAKVPDNTVVALGVVYTPDGPVKFKK